MATSGVPYNPDRSTIVEAIKKRKGVITHICKDLDVAHGTILNYINKDEELKKLLAEARHEYTEMICDMAEGTMIYALHQRDDLPSALSASKFTLNNLGRKRGYNAEGNTYEAPGQAYINKLFVQADGVKIDSKPEASHIDSPSEPTI